MLLSLEYSAALVHLSAVAVAADERIAIGGYYRGQLQLDQTHALPATLDRDGFAVVLDESGNVEWSQAFSGNGAQELTGLAFRADGSLVTQVASDAMATSDTEPVMGEAVVDAFDRPGNLLAETNIISNGVVPSNVVIASNGNAHVCGSFAGPLDCAGLQLSPADGCEYELEVAPDAACVSARTLPGIACDGRATIALDVVGRTFVEGQLADPDAEIGVVDGLDAAGVNIFQRAYRAMPYAFASGLALDSTGGAFIGGEFEGSTDLGGQTFSALITGPNQYDGWVAKYSSANQLEWAHQYTNSGAREGVRVGPALLDHAGNYVIAVTAGFATIEAVQTPATMFNSLNVVKLSAKGDKVWLQTMTGSSELTATGIATDANGNSWLVGDGAIGNNLLQPGFSGAFLLELAP